MTVTKEIKVTVAAADSAAPAWPRFSTLRQKWLHPNLLCRASARLLAENVDAPVHERAAGEYIPFCLGHATGSMDTGRAVRLVSDLFAQYCTAAN